MLASIRPCGIVVSMTEMFTCESQTQVFLYILRTLCLFSLEQRYRHPAAHPNPKLGAVPPTWGQRPVVSAGAPILATWHAAGKNYATRMIIANHWLPLHLLFFLPYPPTPAISYRCDKYTLFFIIDCFVVSLFRVNNTLCFIPDPCWTHAKFLSSGIACTASGFQLRASRLCGAEITVKCPSTTSLKRRLNSRESIVFTRFMKTVFEKQRHAYLIAVKACLRVTFIIVFSP